MNSNFRYEIVIYWSKDDEAFIAEVPELPALRRRWLDLPRSARPCRNDYQSVDRYSANWPTHSGATRQADVRVIPKNPI